MSSQRRPPVCHADCVLPSGESLHSFATGVSLGGAFIVCMKSPPLGTHVEVSLREHGESALSIAGARVIGVRLDPADAKLCGFEVLFPSLDDGQLDHVARLASRLAEAPAVVMGRLPRGRDEARRYPRVAVRLMAQVRMVDATFTASVKNVSMSGALLVVDDPQGNAPLMINVGARLRLTLLSGSDHDTVEIEAEVVRQTAPPEPTGIGVRFVEVNALQTRRLEGQIVYELIMEQRPIALPAVDSFFAQVVPEGGNTMPHMPTDQTPQPSDLTDTQADRRQHERFHTALRLTFISESNFFVGLTENISEGGLFVATHDIKPVGSIIDLRMQLPGTDVTIEAKGEVRWVRPFSDEADGVYPGMGVRFAEISPAALRLVERYLRCRSPLLHEE